MAKYIFDILEILKNTVLITGLVMVMMLMIEYINVITKGHKLKNLQKSPFLQIVISALLGLIPGCIGGFAVVSLFTHNIVNFGALVAAMIASVGDEAFVMYAMIPKTALLIALILFILAIIVGLLTNVFIKKNPISFQTHPNHMVIHQHGDETGDVLGSFKENMKNMSFPRAMLLGGILLFVVSLGGGLLEHSHEAHAPQGIEATYVHGSDCDHDDHHGHIHAHDHGDHSMNFLFSERWLNILFAFVGLITLIIIALVKDHFLEEHLWGHIIKEHFLKIFFWTLGTLIFIYILMQFENQEAIEKLVENYWALALLIAIVIGIIPQSGPHMMFIVLFAGGQIPLSILLANTIVHEGHAGLPLLAESKKGFIIMKSIKIVVAVIVGLAGHFLHY